MFSIHRVALSGTVRSCFWDKTRVGDLKLTSTCWLFTSWETIIVIRWGSRVSTPNLPTNIVDFRGFDSSIILIQRGGIPRFIGDFPESLIQAMLEGVMLVGRLGVIVQWHGLSGPASGPPAPRCSRPPPSRPPVGFRGSIAYIDIHIYVCHTHIYIYIYIYIYTYYIYIKTNMCIYIYIYMHIYIYIYIYIYITWGV